MGGATSSRDTEVKSHDWVLKYMYVLLKKSSNRNIMQCIMDMIACVSKIKPTKLAKIAYLQKIEPLNN